MCGICGYVGRTDPAVIRSMTATMVHRGPDGAGVKEFAADEGRPPAALGHRRLSIIDLSERGAQPMPYANGRYWITYNGELYNFVDLRSELERDGFSFTSDCDTEVLLALYARDGASMLERLNGIFAFAIWDSHRGELFMARDRLGVKPLYYTHAKDVLVFASEIKAILQAVPTPGMRHDAVADYLTFLWVPDPDTLFNGVFKVPPGHCATYANGQLQLEQYWDISFAPEPAGDEVWASRLHDELTSAVRRQTVSDVPLGSFLSGGLDSSLIVAELSRAREKVTTYTVGFSEQDRAHEIEPDDIRYSRLVGKQFGVDYHERILSADVADLLPKLVWHMDEPVADTAAITTYLICSAAREKLTVVLSGMGGDELFAGYPRFQAARIGRALDLLPRSARAAVRRAAEGRLTLGEPGRFRAPRRNLMKLLRGIDGSMRDRHLTYRSYYRPDELPGVLSAEFRAELRGHDPFRHHHDHFERVREEHWLNQLLYVDQKTFLPGLNLAYTDKMSMAASTEVRVPILDNHVVDLAGRIPPELKLKRLTGKYVLKRSMEGVLPREVIWRPKAGFGAPVRSWVAGELAPMIDDLLAPERVAMRGLLDPAAVRGVIEDNRTGVADNALRIWAFLTLELWQQTFLDGTSTPNPVMEQAA